MRLMHTPHMTNREGRFYFRMAVPKAVRSRPKAYWAMVLSHP